MEVQPGIESLATPTLKLMRKGTTAFNNIRFLADCAVEGVKPVWNLLVGFPGELAETYEAYKKTCRAWFICHRLQAFFQFDSIVSAPTSPSQKPISLTWNHSTTTNSSTPFQQR